MRIQVAEQNASRPLVVVDTNIIVADFRFHSPAYQMLLAGAEAGLVDLILPEVALIEVEKHYRIRVSELLSEHARIGRQISAALGRSVPQEPNQLDAETLDYVLYLRSLFEDLDGRVVAIPSVTHEEIIRRAVARRQPFSAKGAGYQDPLIWYTVLSLLTRPGAVPPVDVALVTNNVRDFADKDDRSRLG